MELDKDFKEFLVLINKHKVEYMLVGGYAVAFHGYPRYTGDMDIWINSTRDNGENLVKALVELGFDADSLVKKDFEKDVLAFHLGEEPVRIDIMNSISGIKFPEAYKSKEVIEIEGLKINYISYKDLIVNKKASGRLIDLNDIEKLEQ